MKTAAENDKLYLFCGKKLLQVSAGLVESFAAAPLVQKSCSFSFPLAIHTSQVSSAFAECRVQRAVAPAHLTRRGCVPTRVLRLNWSFSRFSIAGRGGRSVACWACACGGPVVRQSKREPERHRSSSLGLVRGFTPVVLPHGDKLFFISLGGFPHPYCVRAQSGGNYENEAFGPIAVDAFEDRHPVISHRRYGPHVLEVWNLAGSLAFQGACVAPSSTLTLD